MSLCAHVDPKRGQCKRGVHATGFHVYKKLSKIGRKARRERSEADLARAAVKARSQGFCEVYDLVEQHTARLSDVNEVRKRICGTILLHAGTNAHHVHPEDRAAGRHDADRMLWVCSLAHPTWIHGHPSAAKALGLLRPDSQKAST